MKNFRKILFLTVLLASFNFVACGGSSSSGDSTNLSASSSKEDIEKEQRKATEYVCHKIFTCDETKDFSKYFGTEENCVKQSLAKDDSVDQGEDCKDVDYDMVNKCFDCSESVTCQELYDAIKGVKDKCKEYCDKTCRDSQ